MKANRPSGRHNAVMGDPFTDNPSADIHISEMKEAIGKLKKPDPKGQ